MSKLLVDGDAIVFIAASAADGRVYETEDGEQFKYKKEAVQHCIDKGVDQSTISLTYVPEPDSHACHNAKKLLEDVMETAGIVSQCDVLVVLKEGEGSFRKDLNEHYKANRKDAHKPHHIPTVTDYLKRRWNTAITTGDIEVDDALGLHHDEDTIIASHDKDLDMIPGKHVRIKRGGAHEYYDVSEGEAIKFFYKQLLMGDTADNIIGIKGIGPKTADKIIDPLHTEHDMKVACYNAYMKHARKVFEDDDLSDEELEVIHDEACDHMKTNAHLLWIQRADRMTWDGS